VSVEYDSKQYKLSAIVVAGRGPNLLGRDWLTIINVNWSNVFKLSETPFDRYDYLVPGWVH